MGFLRRRRSKLPLKSEYVAHSDEELLAAIRFLSQPAIGEFGDERDSELNRKMLATGSFIVKLSEIRVAVDTSEVPPCIKELSEAMIGSMDKDIAALVAIDSYDLRKQIQLEREAAGLAEGGAMIYAAFLIQNEERMRRLAPEIEKMDPDLGDLDEKLRSLKEML